MSAALPPLPKAAYTLFGGVDLLTEEQTQAYAQQARADLEAENARLREALAEAADCIESWGSYASAYFQHKHNLQGAIDKARSALKEQP